MSYNFNVNDDFYSESKRQQATDNLRQLNFADMSQYPAPGQNQANMTSYFDPNHSFQNQGVSGGFEWGGYFNPNEPTGQQSQPFGPAGGKPATANAYDDLENEPPLLEELGINFDHIYRKTKCVLNPFSTPHESIVDDQDLAGPLVFCIAYGFSLLLLGKVHFGFIYGITAVGCLSMYVLLNLMSEKGVNAACIGSILGYCLLPMVILSFVSVVLTFAGSLRIIVACVFVLWCSVSSSKLFVHSLNMSNQQLLVLYPCVLLYGIFALLNVF